MFWVSSGLPTLPIKNLWHKILLIIINMKEKEQLIHQSLRVLGIISRLAVRPTGPPIQWIPGSFPGGQVTETRRIRGALLPLPNTSPRRGVQALGHFYFETQVTIRKRQRLYNVYKYVTWTTIVAIRKSDISRPRKEFNSPLLRSSMFKVLRCQLCCAYCHGIVLWILMLFVFH